MMLKKLVSIGVFVFSVYAQSATNVGIVGSITWGEQGTVYISQQRDHYFMNYDMVAGMCFIVKLVGSNSKDNNKVFVNINYNEPYNYMAKMRDGSCGRLKGELV